MSVRRGCCACSLCLFCNTFLCFFLCFFVLLTIFLPQELKFHLTNASLTQFNFTNTDNTLYYNLSLDITIRNPNKKVDIYYHSIQVIANYRNKRFAMVTLNSTPFSQGHKNTTILHPVILEGQQLVVFRERDVSKFNSEAVAGIYSIDVKLALQARASWLGKYKTAYYTPADSNVNCNLKVPLSFNKASANYFNTTKCQNVYIYTS